MSIHYYQKRLLRNHDEMLISCLTKCLTRPPLGTHTRQHIERIDIENTIKPIAITVLLPDALERSIIYLTAHVIVVVIRDVRPALRNQKPVLSRVAGREGKKHVYARGEVCRGSRRATHKEQVRGTDPSV